MPVQRNRSILIASDLSPISDEVVRAGTQLATLAGAAVHLIHVQEPSNLPYVVGGEGLLDAKRRVREGTAALAEQLRRVGADGAPQSVQVAFDAPFRAIQSRALEVGADLIVIGPHQERPVGDRLLGTTADRVIRTSDTPVLIVRGPVHVPLRRVLVPTDFSGQSEFALAEAFVWTGALGASPAPGEEATELRVVHVVPQVTEFNLADLERERLRDELRERAEVARGAAPDASRTRVEAEVLQHASPAVEILRAAQGGIDLLVMGTHGRGAVGRALIGSVASAVARRAECPVLLVPPVATAVPTVAETMATSEVLAPEA